MKKIVTTLLLLLIPALLFSAVAWSDVKDPEILSITQDGRDVSVTFNMLTGPNGADRGNVYIYSESGEELFSRAIGRSSREERSAEFTLSESGNYTVVVESERRKESEKKESAPYSFSFLLPLDKPTFSLMNKGSGVIELTINAVDEAEGYVVNIYEDNGLTSAEKTTSLVTSYPLNTGVSYDFEVIAVRGEERSNSDRIRKTAREDAERIWNFASFGQSTKESLNRYEILDSDNLTLRLYSTAYDANGNTIEKGGKFTAFHDGISYYYTEFDPETENFELSATFTIDYINPTADGQEGFGILAMDSLGEDGVSSVNHYTNSAGIIATKFEETINGKKYTSKDTLGARFVTGLSEEIIKGGDEQIALYGKSVSKAFSYDNSDLVKKGDVFRITLKKDNTGYHAIYKREIASEGTIEEFTLYGVEKLEVIDPDKSYVGFAVARGCNATVSDITFTVTDPKTDPPKIEEPDELVPLTYKVDSPSACYDDLYPFVFNANADGRLVVTNSRGKRVINSAVKANEDLVRNLKIVKGINDYNITFTPDESFKPGEKMTIAQYDRYLESYKEDYSPVSISLSVVYMTYESDKLYVSPNGSVFGDGSKENPLDLNSAINFSRPGQTLVLESGTWNLSSPIMIERGNSGKEGMPKTLTVEDGRAILNFEYANGGFQLWGDYWVIENVDIYKTPGNVKGLQIAGDYNIIRNVMAYECGDTGIQISGTSAETIEKWPHDNLIISCVSHDNKDPAENNADGFAAKLTCGEGNKFVSCIAYSNIDDGWDLFSKIESGPIGAVVIEDSVAYKNGSLSDGSGNGDGNGFKLGGDGIAVKHVLRNSISYSNGNAGITSNSNPALIIENVTVYHNGSENITLYGKGGGERLFEANGVLSIDGSNADNISEMSSLIKENNYFFNGARAENSSGAVIDQNVFTSTDTSLIPEIGSDGRIDMKGLLEIKDTSITVGARI